jgi:hypothetical protein
MRSFIVIESTAWQQVTRLTVFDVLREKYFITTHCKRSDSNSRHAAITFQSARGSRGGFSLRDSN